MLANLDSFKTIVNGLLMKFKSDIKKSTADWDQNDSAQSNFIKNRPFYEEINTTDISGASYTISGLTYDEPTKVLDNPIPLELGQVWECTREHRDAGWNSWRTFEVQQADDGTLFLGVPVNEDGTIIEDNMVSIYLTQNEFATDPSIIRNGYHSFKFTCVSGVVTNKSIKQIDEKYVPNIADWNQHDETGIGYIKNRTHYSYLDYVEVTDPTQATGNQILLTRYPKDLEKVTYRVVIGDKIFDNVPYGVETYHTANCEAIGDYGKDSSGNERWNLGFSFWAYEPIIVSTNYVNVPFTVSYPDGSELAQVPTTDIHIYEVVDVVKKIDKKYIPDSALISKMDKENPVGTGSFSMNRKEDTPIGYQSVAEGSSTTASGNSSHAEGSYTTASSRYSHAEGDHTTASGATSHAEGNSTIASGDESHVQGKYNIEDTENKYSHIVGNGTSNTARSNAHTLDWNGVGWFQGGLQVGGNAQDDGAQTVMLNGDKELILTSSTEGSSKKFKITVDDSGTIAVTEITE